MTAIEKLVYNTTEAAQALGIGRTKLYSLMNRGLIRAIRIDNRTFIRPEELRRYLDSLETPVEPSAAVEPILIRAYNRRTS